jgi:sphinganine-1-phosphate aldolase
VKQFLGIDGYVDLVKTTLQNAGQIRAGIAAIDRLQVLGDGVRHLIAMTADPADPDPVDVFVLADALADLGWFHDRQTAPNNLHSTVSNPNTGVIADYIEALNECIAEVGDA